MGVIPPDKDFLTFPEKVDATLQNGIDFRRGHHRLSHRSSAVHNHFWRDTGSHLFGKGLRRRVAVSGLEAGDKSWI
jgi:hypothetical protein